MKKDSQINLKLTTVINIVLVLIIIIICVVSAIIYINSNKEEVAEVNEVQNKNEENEVTENIIEDIKPQIKREKVQMNDEDTNFALEFLKMELNNDNMVYSPLSIKTALNMLKEGANGNTKAQLDKVLENTNASSYNSIEDIMSFANSLFIRDTYAQNAKKEYSDLLFNKYNAEVKYDPIKSANNANKWIEKKTLGQIKDVLSDDTFSNENTKMVLINALAIDMEWKFNFGLDDTYGENFYLENGNNYLATMMHHKKCMNKDVSYFKDDSVTALAMDLEEYENNKMQFIAVMPDENLSEYVKKFDASTYNGIISKLQPASSADNGVNITIPKFSFDYRLKLKRDMQEMGITDAFNDNKADFTNMFIQTSSSGNLFVGDAVHMANIDFSEKGVKAAAVTAIMMEANAMIDEKQPLEIKIDKPFMYFIREKETNDIWFLGTVFEPNSWEDDKDEYR